MSKTITVSVEEKTENKFRKIAGSIYGRKKGYLGKALTKAMQNWINEKEADDLIVKSLALLEKGVGTKKWKFNRDEIYGDRFAKSNR